MDGILVGDTLGMVVLGYETTLPVTMEQMLDRVAAVARAAKRALVVTSATPPPAPPSPSWDQMSACKSRNFVLLSWITRSVDRAGLATEVARLRARFVIKDSDESLGGAA